MSPTIFSIIIGRTKWEDQMKQTVHEYGYGQKLASFEAAGLRVEEFHQNPHGNQEAAGTLARRAPLKKARRSPSSWAARWKWVFYAELQEFLRGRFSANVPVIDCSIAALKAAESAAWQKRIGWTNSRVWGMEPRRRASLSGSESSAEITSSGT